MAADKKNVRGLRSWEKVLFSWRPCYLLVSLAAVFWMSRNAHLYSGTRVIRTARRLAIVSVLSGCQKKLGLRKKVTNTCLLEKKTKADSVTRKPCLFSELKVWNFNRFILEKPHDHLPLSRTKITSSFSTVRETRQWNLWLCTDVFSLHSAR